MKVKKTGYQAQLIIDTSTMSQEAVQQISSPCLKRERTLSPHSNARRRLQEIKRAALSFLEQEGLQSPSHRNERGSKLYEHNLVQLQNQIQRIKKQVQNLPKKAFLESLWKYLQRKLGRRLPEDISLLNNYHLQQLLSEPRSPPSTEINQKRLRQCILDHYSRMLSKELLTSPEIAALRKRARPENHIQNQHYGFNKDHFSRVKPFTVQPSLPELFDNFDFSEKRNSLTSFDYDTLPYFAAFQTYPQTHQFCQPAPVSSLFLDVSKHSRIIQKDRLERRSIAKRLAVQAVGEVYRRYGRSQRQHREHVMRAKKVFKEVVVYWRKRQKQLIQIKKKEQKLKKQLIKRDQEERDTNLHRKRLEFLMTQSDLYAHFMAKKLGLEGSKLSSLEEVGQEKQAELLKGDVDCELVLENLKQMHQVQQQQLKQFDKMRVTDLSLSKVQNVNQFIKPPQSFCGTLKEYQMNGLRWLDNLHDQGINGILADQMGLGKTIQAIALLAHIGQKGFWGPFLVVAPSSTLYNWQSEINKFCPQLKVLPYWGNIKQRKTIRKFFNVKKFTGQKDSSFHVVITSYQLIVADQKAFHRLKWQYMILDEAQAIKNVTSQRWKTLMGFSSRNRLLLTGTPIQNTMAQLWALLHFIMPKLFDSHQQFQQWFSKDIEAHSQDQKSLNQHQIQRLHKILKPFMLRRVKKDVQHQIGKKIQFQVMCQLTSRQQKLYDSIKRKLSLKDFFKLTESKANNDNLMNLVMQFRKVCNHPQLFQRRLNRSPMLFNKRNYNFAQLVDRSSVLSVYFNSNSEISFTLPRIIYDQLLLSDRSFPHRLTASHVRLLDFFSLIGLGRPPWLLPHESLRFIITLNHQLTHQTSFKSLSTKQGLYFYNPHQQFRQLQLVSYHSFKHLKSFVSICSALPPNLFVNSAHFVNAYHSLLSPVHPHLDPFFPHKGSAEASLQASISQVQLVSVSSLIVDSAKLKYLDKLLKQKKALNQRVLIFCQMTKMLNILQDYMMRMKYNYFRLDGSVNIPDRRDMVNQFQTNPKIFAFLLSTRAGGLGVTLTAADVVIFFDNDWNPTMDAQATDRAHRIGRKDDVYVYRLVTKNTIQERIVTRAQQKQTVQSTVYEGSSIKMQPLKNQEIIELMFDEKDIQQKKAMRREGVKLGRIHLKETE